jgi:hypothetical protein
MRSSATNTKRQFGEDGSIVIIFAASKIVRLELAVPSKTGESAAMRSASRRLIVITASNMKNGFKASPLNCVGYCSYCQWFVAPFLLLDKRIFWA